jgi:hypothetical protein
MTPKAVPVAVYSGDTLRNLLRRYSDARMQRDPGYRADVEQEMQRRRDAKKEGDQ